jgi:hypothetical protein
MGDTKKPLEPLSESQQVLQTYLRLFSSYTAVKPESPQRIETASGHDPESGQHLEAINLPMAMVQDLAERLYKDANAVMKHEYSDADSEHRNVRMGAAVFILAMVRSHLDMMSEIIEEMEGENKPTLQ